jgi:hypothetical protein
MIAHPITVQLPLPLYDRLKHRAEQSHTTIEEEVLQAVAAAVPETMELDVDLNDALTQLAMLDDEALKRAAKSHLAGEIATQLESLHLRRQREGLNATQERELENYIKQYERAMLIRAQAAVLLKQRGVNESETNKRMGTW